MLSQVEKLRSMIIDAVQQELRHWGEVARDIDRGAAAMAVAGDVLDRLKGEHMVVVNHDGWPLDDSEDDPC